MTALLAVLAICPIRSEPAPHLGPFVGIGCHLQETSLTTRARLHVIGILPELGALLIAQQEQVESNIVACVFCY
jgi:hypothetical protein